MTTRRKQFPIGGILLLVLGLSLGLASMVLRDGGLAFFSGMCIGSLLGRASD